MHEDEFAFRGAFEFDLELRAFGHAVVRRVRVTYGYTPEWPYYDWRDRPPLSYAISLGAELYVRHDEPEHDEVPGAGRPQTPSWVKINELIWNGVLAPSMRAKIDKLVDEDAKRLNHAREKAGGYRLVDPSTVEPPDEEDHIGPVAPLTPKKNP